MTIQWQRARFIKSCIWPEHYPALFHSTGEPIAQVAVAGRSNVGKSSLLNALFQSKSLVKTSSTPGKTQMINFFAVGDTLFFADLPGYGYAKVPLEIKKQWGPMVQSYFNHARGLKLLLLLLDIRRTPTGEDLELLDWAKAPLLVVLSKADTLKVSEQKVQEKKIRQTLSSFGDIPILTHSSKTDMGTYELRRFITENI